MKRARFTCLLGLLLGAAMPCLSQDVTIIPSGPNIIVPSVSFELMAGLGLSCGLELEGVNYETQWILPGGGEMVNSTSSSERFFVAEVPVSINGRTLPGTLLSIFQLSYQDAGTYTCEGRSTAPGASTLWASASFELQLNLELLSNMSTVNATMNDSTVALKCEMRAYIRPDSFLIWEGPGGQRIAGGTGKHQITFSNGSPGTAVNGGGVLVPSRVSTLVISNPEPSDVGTYTCRVMGVNNVVVTIDLLVDGLRGIETTDIISTTVTTADTNTTRFDTRAASTSTTASSSNNSTLPVIGAVIGSVAVVVLILAGLLAVAVCCVIRTQNKSRNVQVSIIDSGIQHPVYDCIDLPELKLDDDHGINRRYSGPPNLVKQNDRDDYDEIKDDAEIYDEIRDTRTKDDDTYDSIDIKIVNTTETNCSERLIDSEKSGVYDVPIDGHGTLDQAAYYYAENDVLGVNRDGADTAERNDDHGGTIQDDYDYAEVAYYAENDIVGVNRDPGADTAETRNKLEADGGAQGTIQDDYDYATESDVFGVNRDPGVDTAEKNKLKADGGVQGTSQNDYDYADIDTMVDS